MSTSHQRPPLPLYHLRRFACPSFPLSFAMPRELPQKAVMVQTAGAKPFPHGSELSDLVGAPVQGIEV